MSPNAVLLVYLIFIPMALMISGPALAQDPESTPPFTEHVDLTAFGHLAVHAEGRVKSFDSFAAGVMKYVTGPRGIEGQSDALTYLDLMLRPDQYHALDAIYVKNKLIRAGIAGALSDHVDAERLDRFVRKGLISPALLQDARVQAVLDQLSTDLMTTARYVDAIRTALGIRDPMRLRQNLRLIPPPGGGLDDAWFSLDELTMMGDRIPALAAMDAELREALGEQWMTFTERGPGRTRRP